MLNWFKQKITGLLIRYLTGKVRNYEPFAVSTPESLDSVLQVADIILIEGNQRFSTAVKYLRQSRTNLTRLRLRPTRPVASSFSSKTRPPENFRTAEPRVHSHPPAVVDER